LILWPKGVVLGNMTRAFYPLMKARGGGAIISVIGNAADIGGSRHTSDVPPSRGQKGNVGEPTRVKKARKGHPGAARALAESPDATRDVYADRCLCGTALEEAGPVDRGE
jgi:hypothetical protein